MEKVAFNRTQDLAFQASLESEKKHSARITSTLGALLFVCLTVINYFALSSEAFFQILPITVATLFGLTFFHYLTYRDCFLKYYNLIGTLTFLAVGIAICAMIALSPPGRFSHNVYFVSLMLLIVTTFSWSYMPRMHSTMVTASLIGIFMLVNVFIQNAFKDDLIIFIASVFFLIAAASIVATAQGIRNRYIRKNFLLQEQLQINLVEKAKEAQRQKDLANKDALTGLPNRRFITKALQQSILKAQQDQHKLVLMFLDLNGFKAINDTFGHDAGDEILKITSKRLQNCIRKTDHIARLGGDEFLIGLVISETEDDVADIIRKDIRNTIVKPVKFNNDTLSVGTSIGVATYPEDGDDIEALIKLADEKMYADKIRIKAQKKNSAEAVA